MPEENNCPKPDCGRPESTHRWSAGKKLSICGNGHSWDQQEVIARREAAKEAESQEVRLYGYSLSSSEVMKRFRDTFGGSNPFI